MDGSPTSEPHFHSKFHDLTPFAIPSQTVHVSQRSTERDDGAEGAEVTREGGRMAVAAAAATVGSQAPITSLPHKRARKKGDRLRKLETRKGTGQAKGVR